MSNDDSSRVQAATIATNNNEPPQTAPTVSANRCKEKHESARRSTAPTAAPGTTNTNKAVKTEQSKTAADPTHYR